MQEAPAPTRDCSQGPSHLRSGDPGTQSPNLSVWCFCSTVPQFRLQAAEQAALAEGFDIASPSLVGEMGQTKPVRGKGRWGGCE